MTDAKEIKKEVPTIIDLLDTLIADGWEEGDVFPVPETVYSKEFKEGYHYITVRDEKEQQEYDDATQPQIIRNALSPTGRKMMGMIPKDVENTIENFLNDLRWYMTKRYKDKYPKHKGAEEVDRKINEIETAIDGFIAIEQEN